MATKPSAIASGEIRKVDDEKRLVFGWAYVAKTAAGDQVVDHSGEFIDDPQNLEEVAVDYVLNSREGDEMHAETVTSRLVESVVFTPDKLEKMGLAKDAAPLGWWVGFKIDSDETWKRVKKGELRMFSIFGVADKEEVGA